MVNDGTLGRIFAIFSVPAAAWTLVLMVAVALFKVWPKIMAQVNERQRDREEAKASDWERLRGEIERLDGRCDHLQQEVDECRRREGEWMQRAIEAEAMLVGRGKVNQEVTILQSAQRLIEDGK